MRNEAENRWRRLFLALLLGVLLSVTCRGRTCPAQDKAPDYDLIIRNGRVVDGTGNPWFYADVGVKGDRIVRVGRNLPGTAKHEIDAKGRVVSPGFIDIHSHSDFLLLEDGDAQSKIRQGVTTEILGEGNSAGPYRNKLPRHRVDVNGESVRLATLGDYFDAVERAGISTNVASYVGSQQRVGKRDGHILQSPHA